MKIDANAKEGMVTFKPLKVDRIAKKYLLQYGDTVLFMSATILSKKLFCKWLGIKQEEAYFLKVPTPFKTENRPIILDFAGEMTNRKIKRSQVKALPIIRKILSKHENEKGLIDGNFLFYPLINERGECLWPGKYPNPDYVKAEKRKVGSEITWQQEYLLKIVPSDEQVIYGDWIQYYDVIPERKLTKYGSEEP